MVFVTSECYEYASPRMQAEMSRKQMMHGDENLTKDMHIALQRIANLREEDGHGDSDAEAQFF